MDKSGKENVGFCFWEHRFGIVGVILIALATFVTLYAHIGAGIVMMFLVGLALCFHRHLSSSMNCHYHDHHLDPSQPVRFSHHRQEDNSVIPSRADMLMDKPPKVQAVHKPIKRTKIVKPKVKSPKPVTPLKG